MNLRIFAAVTAAAALGVIAAAPPASAATGKSIDLISQSASGEVAKHGGSGPILSATGRYVVFDSFADNLVPRTWSNNGAVFLSDRETGALELISVNDDGVEANSYVSGTSISADGRYVTFQTNATNVVVGAGGRYNHVYLRDRQTRKTTLISADAEGKPIDGYNQMGTVSDDGRFVVFTSHGENVVPGDTNGKSDVFLRDLAAGTIERVSLGVDGEQRTLPSTLPDISADGRFVTFVGEVTPGHLDQRAVFLRDRQTGTTEEVSLTDADQRSALPMIDDAAPVSTDGRYVAFTSRSTDLVAGDTNASADVFLRDRVNATTERVSLNPDGTQIDRSAGAPAMTADGRRIAFARQIGWSPHGFRADEVYIWTKRTNAVRRISNDGKAVTTSNYPGISDDGKTVSFQSFYAFAENDTNDDLDIYVRTL